MNNLPEQLIIERPVVTDGAWATQLQSLGLRIGECPDAWNLTSPDSVAEVAVSYIAAGSHIILTNTFGANRIALARWGLACSVEQINLEGVRISKQAAGDSALVFGSIGPCGLMSTHSPLDTNELRSAFEEQAALLAEGGVDALVLETMFNLDEALIALKAAKKTGLPVVACITYMGAANQPGMTWSGDTVEEATIALVSAGADAIGVNCGAGAHEMIPICERLKAVCSLPIWMKPNAGLPDLTSGLPTYRMGPHAFADEALALVEAGADFIGGCCGTNPEHIREVKRRIETKCG